MPRNILHLALVIFSILDLASHGGSDETGTVMYMTLAAGCGVGLAAKKVWPSHFARILYDKSCSNFGIWMHLGI